MRGFGPCQWFGFTLILLLFLSASLRAADTSAAIVYARGTAWVNGAAIPRSSAIFPGDMVQTKADTLANINLQGSSVAVAPDSLIKFEGDAVLIEHGGVTVGTSKTLATHVGDITITPATANWTEFQVADVDGTVKIMARKGDVIVTDTSGKTTVAAGQETTREETQKRRRRQEGGAVAAAHGGILDSRAAIIVGTAAVTGVTAWVLLQGDDPASPDKP
jgi:hypothetical protein